MAEGLPALDHIPWDEHGCEATASTLRAVDGAWLGPAHETTRAVTLGALFEAWAEAVDPAPLSPVEIARLARHEPATVAARLLRGGLDDEATVAALAALGGGLAGRPGGGIVFVVQTLRRRSLSQDVERALRELERRMRMSSTAQRLERFLEEARASRAAEEDPALERLREVQREIEEAYDAIDRLLCADPPVTVEEKQAAFAVLQDALAREADATARVLAGRMSSLERTAENARRADELIARYERGGDS